MQRRSGASCGGEGIEAARCTVDRLMRSAGLRGVMRSKVVNTIAANAAAPFQLDRIHRQFKAQRPNQLWVSDFTLVSTWQGCTPPNLSVTTP